MNRSYSLNSVCPKLLSNYRVFRKNRVLLRSKSMIKYIRIDIFLQDTQVYIFLSLFVLQKCVLMLMPSTTFTLFLSAKLLKQGYRYNKIRKTFLKFYHRHSELIVKYNIGLKTLLQQGISEPIIHGD